MTLLDRIDRGAERLIRLSALAGTIGLLVAAGVVLVDVVGRYFGAPLRGAQDISTMAMVIIVFGGMALCDRVGGHISVDILEPSMPGWLKTAGDLASDLLGAAIFIGLAVAIWESAGLSQMLNLATNIISLPKAWFQYAAVVMSAITALGMLLRAALTAIGRNPRRRLQEAK